MTDGNNHDELLRWHHDRLKALEEWCATMTEWCQEDHRRMSDLEAIVIRMGIVASVADKPPPPPPPADPPKS